MQKITTCLWFDDQAEEAAKLYTDVFSNSRILNITHYGEAGQEVHGKRPGSVMTVEFELDGQKFTALNGGPHFEFTEAISLSIDCVDQEEVDWYWSRLSEGGEEGPCGWLKDRYGLSWQVVPRRLPELLNSGNTEKSGRVMEAMLKMRKIEIEGLEKAYRNE